MAFRSSRQMIGVAAGFRIGPESSAVTVLGHPQKQDHKDISGRLWITIEFIHRYAARADLWISRPIYSQRMASEGNRQTTIEVRWRLT